MESLLSVDMQDYWNEYRTLKEGELEPQGHHSEEDSRSQDDDSDDTFLEAVLPSENLKGDKEINETDLANSRLYFTLTERQKAQLIRRTQERNHTIRKKRFKVRNQKPDLWSIFSGAADNSSTGTRSRSGTPDSLDSISPPRTPPDPSPQNWVDPHLSRSRASLDSGHHSLVIPPTSSLSPSYIPPQHGDGTIDYLSHRKPDAGKGKGGKRVIGRRFSPPHLRSSFYYAPEEEEDRESRRIYRPSSLDMLEVLTTSDKLRRKGDQFSSSEKDASVRRQRSYVNDISREVKEYYDHKGQYTFAPALQYDPNIPDVQGLLYKPIGSLHIPHCKTSKERRDPFEMTSQESREKRTVRRSHSIKYTPRDTCDQGPIIPSGVSTSTPFRLTFDKHSSEENATKGGRISAADFGFKVLTSSGFDGEDFPEIIQEVGRSGRTEVSWLHERDLGRLRALSLLELDIIFSEYDIHHSWRKRNKKRKSKEVENAVFGASLETLRAKDETDSSVTELQVPQVLLKLVTHLELRGLQDEGILRIPGHRAKTEELRKYLDENFYSSPSSCDSALRTATPYEVASLIKLFLRDLPQPLLTHNYTSAFYKTHRIPNLGERVIALTMLIILLPTVYRDTLKVILDLCARIIEEEVDNKMGLYNVAMIVAPNIFLPSLQPKHKVHLRADDNEQILNCEMEYAKVTTQLVEVLIKYREVLWTIPNRLIAQIRHQYESGLKTSNSKPIYKLLGKKNKDLVIERPIMNEVDYQNGVLRITAPQFNKMNFPVKLDWKMTAADILARLIEEGSMDVEAASKRVAGRREQKQATKVYRTSSAENNSVASLPKSLSMTTCLLRGSSRQTLDNHAIHEKGGNITEKRVDPAACLIAVYQDNPNGQFLVKCHHPGGVPVNP